MYFLLFYFPQMFFLKQASAPLGVILPLLFRTLLGNSKGTTTGRA